MRYLVKYKHYFDVIVNIRLSEKGKKKIIVIESENGLWYLCQIILSLCVDVKFSLWPKKDVGLN